MCLRILHSPLSSELQAIDVHRYLSGDSCTLLLEVKPPKPLHSTSYARKTPRSSHSVHWVHKVRGEKTQKCKKIRKFLSSHANLILSEMKYICNNYLQHSYTFIYKSTQKVCIKTTNLIAFSHLRHTTNMISTNLWFNTRARTSSTSGSNSPFISDGNLQKVL